MFALTEHKIWRLKGGSKALQPGISCFKAMGRGGMAALELQANLKDLEQAQQPQEGGKNGVCYGGSWRVTLKCV